MSHNVVTQAVLAAVDPQHPTLAAFLSMLNICMDIASDPKVDLVTSERRLRLYAALARAGVDASTLRDAVDPAIRPRFCHDWLSG